MKLCHFLTWNLSWFFAAVRIKCEFLQLVNKTLHGPGPTILSCRSVCAPPHPVLCGLGVMAAVLSSVWNTFPLPFGPLANSCPFCKFLCGYRPVLTCCFLYTAFCDFWEPPIVPQPRVKCLLFTLTASCLFNISHSSLQLT